MVQVESQGREGLVYRTLNSTMGTDDLGTQGAKASAATV